MFQVFRRAWAYMVAALSGKLDERADPKIQIEQAITEAKRQHQLLSEQAAAVLGNRHQLEMKLDKQMDEVERLQASARQALVLAEQARAAGDEKRAGEYENAAQSFATQLVTAEKSVEDLKALHDQALQAAEAAKGAVAQNAQMLQQRMAERTRLLSQLDQAKMAERVNEALQSVSSLSVQGNVPSLDQVREKIEGRYARAMGASELAQNSVEARMMEVQRSSVDMEGAQRLEALRASMGMSKTPAAAPAAEETPAAQPATADGDAKGRARKS
ncbi:MAG TPA: PspA/IM30 family protein [Frankiaceae bacterium]|nr:PspA/IM30 family protein [Frankiaceae bacterium]